MVSIAGGRRLLSEFLSVAPRVRTKRMRERRRAVGTGKGDVVGRRAFLGVEAGQVPDALGDFVIGAGGVAAHAETTDPRAPFVQRHAAAKRHSAAADPAIRRRGLV